MPSAAQWQNAFKTGACDAALCRLYVTEDPLPHRQRYLELLERFARQFGEREEVRLFSAPGRTELGGNHTDHQNGRVLAAAVTLDKLAAVSPQPQGAIEITSSSHPLPPIDWRDLAHYPAERGHSPSLIRGILAGFAREGYAAGGFLAYTDSCVPTGSGLSSSASFELLMGEILNRLYNEGAIPPVPLARLGQYAENEYFGKPCGLMDQMAAAVGNAVSIDFLCPQAPVVESIPCGFEKWGMSLYVVNTGGSHSDLTEDYAAIPREMREVAACFGCRTLREVAPGRFEAELPALRGRVSDRAILRAMHFFAENERVPRMAAALRQETPDAYLEEMLASGESSFFRLQNIFPADSGERSLALALSLCEELLKGAGGWRVHGGGFAGTVQALVPRALERDFCRRMSEVFGPRSCTALRIRPVGSCEFPFPG